MTAQRIIRRVGLPAVVGVGLLVAAFWTVRVQAQDQTTGDLWQHLKDKGVPVRSLQVASRLPFVVKLDVQSTSQTADLQPEDLYNAQIVRRAVLLFYRHGQRLDGYELQITNDKGQAISWESKRVSPGDTSQQSLFVTPSKVSDADTEALVRSAVSLPGLTVDKIQVVSDRSLGDSAQELNLQFTSPDVATTNRVVVPFLVTVHALLDKLNAQHGTRLSLCWIIVRDPKRQILLNYVWDVETREETSLQMPGVDAWYPVPATQAPILPTASAAGALGYPGPGPTPTTRPYP